MLVRLEATVDLAEHGRDTVRGWFDNARTGAFAQFFDPAALKSRGLTAGWVLASDLAAESKRFRAGKAAFGHLDKAINGDSPYASYLVEPRDAGPDDELALRLQLTQSVFRDTRALLALDLSATEEECADPAFCSGLVEHLRRCLDQASPVFGSISSANFRKETPLDLALNRSIVDSVQLGRTVLRGYSWVTVCPEELLPRVAAGQAGGFHRTIGLAAGGAVLQATPTIAEFGRPAAEQVFDLVRTVLPAGLPAPSPLNPDALLVYRDAAQG
ncbi:hypothetical protein [Streptomyces tateyamensis]|uniref:hypothetical protein n=1 Tax=Streptomyces tateyamensis TaxID=565073 RepID=UPI0015E8894E|nr:hypothetical protein [Streptomyces tateyamensis]